MILMHGVVAMLDIVAEEVPGPIGHLDDPGAVVLRPDPVHVFLAPSLPFGRELSTAGEDDAFLEVDMDGMSPSAGPLDGPYLEFAFLDGLNAMLIHMVG